MNPGGGTKLTEEQRRMVAAALSRVASDIWTRQNDFIELNICPDLVERMGLEATEHEELADIFRSADVVRVRVEAARGEA